MNEKEVKQYLEEHKIAFKEFEHSAVFTCEEAKQDPVYSQIQGVHSKNLFLKNRKSKKFYLVILPEHKAANMHELGKLVGEKLKFANENNLFEILGLTPGSVSPFGLLNDTENIVSVLIDTQIWESEFVSFHPNVNTQTLELKRDDFHKYIESIGNEFRVIDLK